MNLIEKIRQGKIFIYPTDTIYGIGCNALNKKSIEKIKVIKKRENKPLSVIAPSIEWIKKNLIIDIDLKKYLPGPYTLLLKKKDRDFLKHVSDNELLGVRIPDCDFTELIQKSEVPFITTSVNLSGEPPVKKISEIPLEIKNKIDVIVDVGPLTGKPSTLVINGREIKR
ncbi:threonylcarbamoyl-AMP synthase [Candidatus Pacearchaeota archaeon]|nr:threonylcarbamoyl-AMP synthase [Candidatus Pacearchaeota archaeon]MBD3283394.1 threonylcarbamoyl-AMP synthase [Candidatus Pacearchaeota archaeon]